MRKLAMLILATCCVLSSAVCASAEGRLEYDESYFDGKVWLVIGDSISEHNDKSKKNYDEYISELLNVKVINVATSGTGYVQAYWKYDAWLDLVDTLPEHVDFITVMGGLNDIAFPLGDIRDTERHTYYGGVRQFYQSLTERYPKTPIGVITSPPRYNRWGDSGAHGAYATYVDAVIKIAKEYSLPTLDLYRESEMRPWDPNYSRIYFSAEKTPEGDGVHPNELGQKIIADKVYDFIISELGPRDPYRDVFALLPESASGRQKYNF